MTATTSVTATLKASRNKSLLLIDIDSIGALLK
jgi:hypothetical protein